MRLLPRKTFSPLNNMTTKIQLKNLGWNDVAKKIDQTATYLDSLDAQLSSDPTENDASRAVTFGKQFNKKVESLAASIDSQNNVFQQLLQPMGQQIKDDLSFKSTMEQAAAFRMIDMADSPSEALNMARKQPLAAKAILQDPATQIRLDIQDRHLEKAADIHAKSTLGPDSYATYQNLNEARKVLINYSSELMDIYAHVNETIAPIVSKTTKLEE